MSSPSEWKTFLTQLHTSEWSMWEQMDPWFVLVRFSHFLSGIQNHTLIGAVLCSLLLEKELVLMSPNQLQTTQIKLLLSKHLRIFIVFSLFQGESQSPKSGQSLCAAVETALMVTLVLRSHCFICVRTISGTQCGSINAATAEQIISQTKSSRFCLQSPNCSSSWKIALAIEEVVFGSSCARRMHISTTTSVKQIRKQRKGSVSGTSQR